jgi:hypothetical protein
MPPVACEEEHNAIRFFHISGLWIGSNYSVVSISTDDRYWGNQRDWIA